MSSPHPNAKDDAAFDVFVRAHSDILRQFFRRRIVIQADVEDLVQEVFLRLARHGLGDIAHHKGYLFRTALNVLRDQLRSKAAHHSRNQTTLDEDYVDDRGFSPERVVIARDTISKIEEALLEIPDRTRIVFGLSRFGEMTNAHIAQQLAISESAVEKHLNKAMLHLSERLAGLL